LRPYLKTYSQVLILWYIDCSETDTSYKLKPMKNLDINVQICDHKNALQAFALKYTQDIDDANDLVQDTLLKAFRYSGLFKQGTNLRGWLFTILKNTYINEYRRIKRKENVIVQTEEISNQNLSNNAESNTCNSKFVTDDINKILSKLQPEYYIPFVKYFEGYKYQEIAEMLDIPIGTVKTRIHLARQILKSRLKVYAENMHEIVD
jgi:RNA polymerase sigma factor (sigma-70 family)